MAQSVAPTGNYALGRIVFDRLLEQLPSSATIKFKWELRIVPDDEFNAYSSPDGAIYVETGLARLAGPSAGLWAAILSHEIAHVIRRDWARRYLFQKSLTSGAVMVLGDPGMPSTSDSHWSDAQSASEKFARLCRQLEIEADRDGLTLMAKAGYHPDFVPALHHLLHAQPSTSDPPASLSAMHPCWEERDRELSRSYVEADIAFEHRWLDWYASPGGNPPTLVFTETPRIRKTGLNEKTGAKEWELQVPMRCENLVGAIEVVLRSATEARNNSLPAGTSSGRADDAHLSPQDERQVTGCTSPLDHRHLHAQRFRRSSAQPRLDRDLHLRRLGRGSGPRRPSETAALKSPPVGPLPHFIVDGNSNVPSTT